MPNPRIGMSLAAEAALLVAAAAAVLVGANGRLSAQSATASQSFATVQGQVRSSDDKPVVGAVISSPASRIAVRSDSLGFYRLTGFSPGQHVISAHVIGFEPVTVTVRTRENEILVADIRFSSTVQRLRAVESIAKSAMKDGQLGIMEDFFMRQKKGFGRFVTREQLRSSFSLGQVFSEIPGMRVFYDAFNQPSVSFTRCTSSALVRNSIAYYVDGSRTFDQSALALYGTNDLEAIEIYRGVSELPVDAVGNACAAVFLWTRRSP